MKHPSPDELQRLGDLAFDRESLGALAWHLYRCAECRSSFAATSSAGQWFLDVIFRGRVPPEDVALAGPSYRAAFATARRRAVERSAVTGTEKRVAREAMEWLAPLPAEERERRVLADPRLHSWALAEELLDTYRRDLLDDPAKAEAWVRLTLEVASALRERSDPFRPDDRLIADLEARSLSCLATCLRVRSRLREADRTIRRAETRLEHGTGDLIELARVLEAKASLRRAQRRFGEALELTERAGQLYRQLGDPARRARTLINRATLEGYLERQQSAIETLEEALEVLDPAAEPALWMSATYNLATTLHEAGRSAEAAETLAVVRPHVEASAGVVNRARFTWFEGMVARDGDDPALAERLFGRVREEFVRLEMGYEVALVSLDLAALYLDQGRTAETRRLAESMLPIFRSREIHREANAALLLFHRAALAETASASLVGEVAAAVRRGQAQGTRRADEPVS